MVTVTVLPGPANIADAQHVLEFVGGVSVQRRQVVFSVLSCALSARNIVLQVVGFTV